VDAVPSRYRLDERCLAVRSRLLPRPGVRGPVDNHRRQLHGEGCALADAIARCGHSAAMQLGELLRDRQPEAEATLLAREGRVALSKSLEDEREKVRSNAAAGVAYGDLDLGIGARELELDPPAPRCELDGVRQEVPDDL